MNLPPHRQPAEAPLIQSSVLFRRIRPPLNREGDESFKVVLSDPTGAYLANDTGTVTITADPVVGQATFSISGGAAAEGGKAVVTITRGGDMVGEVSVHYGTQDGNAKSGSDYGSTDGTVVFAAGETSKTVEISIVSDGNSPQEGPESFSVVLSDPVGGTISGGSATVNIAADTAPPPPPPPPPPPVTNNAPVFLGAAYKNPYAQFDGGLDGFESSGTLTLGTHTIEARIRNATVNSDYQTIVALADDHDDIGLIFQIHNGKLRLYMENNDGDQIEVESTTTVADDEWHHVAYTFNATTSSLHLYVDGVEVGFTYLNSNNADLSGFTATKHVSVGGSFENETYTGGIDEVGIWNVVRTPAQILANQNLHIPTAGTGLQVYYTFEDLNSTTHEITNKVAGGATLNAVVSDFGYMPPVGGTDVPYPLSVRILGKDDSRPIEFNSTNATYIATGLSDSVDRFATDGDLTIEAKIRLDPGGTGDRVILSRHDSGSGYDFKFYVDANNHLVVEARDSANNYRIVSSGDTSKFLQGGIWYDVAAVYDATSNDLKVYIDGVQVDIENIGGRGPLANMTVDIGRFTSGNPNYFDGYISQVRIWNTALDTATIGNHTDFGVPPDASDLVLIYDFTEGFGTVLNDATDHGLDGTIVGATEWTPDFADLIDNIASFNTTEDRPVSFRIFARDNDGGTITLATSTAPAHGTLTYGAGLTVRYMPGANFNGTDSFTLQISDGQGGVTTKTYTVNVTAVLGSRNITGTVDVNYDLTYQGGTLTNAGVVNIATSKSLKLSSGVTLVQSGGGTYTGAGTINFDGGATFQMNAAASIAPNIIFGTASTAATWTGAYTATLSGTTTLNRGTVSSNLVIASGGTVQVVENNNTATTISGTVTVQSGGSLRVEDNANTGGGSQLNISGALSNAGTITLTTTFESQSETLDLTGGGLTNAAGGVVNLATGSGSGTRTIIGIITNAGTITASATSVFNIGAGTLTNSSGGTITVANGTTTVSGSGTFNNAGAISVASGRTLALSGTTTLVHQTGGTYTGAGTIGFAGGATFQMNAAASIAPNIIFGTTSTAATWTGAYTATLSGTTTLNRGTVSSNLVIASGGTVQVVENNNTATTISGTVTVQSGGSLRVEDNANTGGGSTLKLSNTVDNNSGGVIGLTVTGGSQSTNLDLTGGALNNNTGATLQTLVGNGLGSRNITGTVNNSGGTVDVNYDLTYQGGTLTNAGVVNIATSKSLKLSSGVTLVQSGGGTYTGAGTINFDGGATFQMNAAASIAPNIIFGTASTAATWTGAYTATLAGTTTLNKGTVSSNIDNTGTLQVVDNNNTATVVSGTVANTGTILVQDTGDGAPSQLTLSNTVNNNTGGVITLTVTGGSNSANLDLTGGMLNNNTGATLQTAVGNGVGSHTITGKVNNAGSILLHRNTAFDIGAVSLDNMSGGQFTIDSGVTVNIQDDNNNSRTFHNLSGGTLTVNGTLNLNGTDLLNDGTITGTGTISLGSNGGNAATFTNHGISFITPGASPGMLTIDGNMVLGQLTRTVMELGGRTAGYFDVLNVANRFSLGGTLAVVSYAGFAAAAGDQFDIMTWGNHEGMFQEGDGLDSMPGVALDPTFGDHGLSLTARAITADGTDNADTLVGSGQDDVLVGRGGDDVLDGGLGNDLLLGGAGNDVLKGGAGSNHLIGGEGTDTVDYSESTSGVHVDLANGVAENGLGGTDTLISVEHITGTSYDDILIGNSKANIMLGGAGNDVIVGGLGADTLTGGAGNDTFVLHSPNEGGDTITDFTTGQDKIEFDAAAFGFGPNTQVGTCFSVIAGQFDGNNAGTNAAFASGQAALIYSQADHALYYDANGVGEGYTTVVTFQSGAVLAATDIRITDHLAA